MRKKLIIVAAIGTTALALGGCSASGGEDPDTIELWTSWTEGESTAVALEPLIEAWAEENGYTVNQSNFTYDQIHEKLIASAAGGNLPDVVWGLPEYVGEFQKIGVLADVSDAWEAWEDASLVSDSVKAAMTTGGAVVGFPYETTVRAYLVHDDLLAESGVSVPETWDDVLAVGSTVEDATGSSFYGLTGAGVRQPQELFVYLAQKGLSIAEEQPDGGYANTWNDDPEQLVKATEVFQFYADLMDSGAVNPNSATYGWEETDDNFATGLTATFVTGNWLGEREASNPETMGDVSVHAIPYPEDGEPATYLESKPMFVMANSESLEASTELAEQFASEEWQSAAFADRSALSSVTTDSKWSKGFAELLDTGVAYPPVSLGEITQDMQDALAMVLQDGESPEAAAMWLSDAINEALEASGDASGS
ncbi:extracellular solute-binding protein [Microbacterium betulae]|uniref:Extracellular solute-binding protein n=1 Tax=Microbacterium betulae TaxID=2981139 RepID=A0AA97I6C8_9MICO|nr:extracellular solute-binding protein [Microbacterium sp. AB]WOF22335.1 extracellular solute-binding protein [Microbacterium sp. AB]